MRFLAAIAIVSLLGGCVTTEQAQTSRQSVRVAKAQALKQQQQQHAASRSLVLGLAY